MAAKRFAAAGKSAGASRALNGTGQAPLTAESGEKMRGDCQSPEWLRGRDVGFCRGLFAGVSHDLFGFGCGGVGGGGAVFDVGFGAREGVRTDEFEPE